MMKVVLMAGGKGTRIQSIARHIPKPMIPVGGVPVLEREIISLRSQGFTELIITVSHLASAIVDYFGDGSRFGVNIQYFYEETPLGNGGALFKLADPYLRIRAAILTTADWLLPTAAIV